MTKHPHVKTAPANGVTTAHLTPLRQRTYHRGDAPFVAAGSNPYNPCCGVWTMRRLARLLPLALAGHLTLAGCERLPPTETAPMPVSFSLETPDESFRLDAAERANIGDDYDPDALERLLQMVHPDYRIDILANFQIQPFDGRKRPYFIEILDPKVQPLLDPVYAPVWQNATDEEIEANIYGLPGRETVKKQRREIRDRRRADPE